MNANIYKIIDNNIQILYKILTCKIICNVNNYSDTKILIYSKYNLK